MTRALLLLALVGCGRALVPWHPIDNDAVPRFQDHPEAPAALALDEQIVRFHEVAGAPVVDSIRRRHGRVFTDAGRELLRTRVYYRRGLSKLLSLRARVRRPDGHVDHFGLHDALDAVAWPSWVLYSDDRVVILDLSYAPVGSYVEVETTVRHSQPRLFQFSHQFGGPWPIATSRLSVSAPVEWKLAWERREGGVPQPLTAPAIGQTAEFVRTHLPAQVTEPHGPAAQLMAETVSVHLRSWREKGFDGAPALSRWLFRLAEGTDEVTPRLREIATRTAGEGTAYIKAARLYDWAQEQVSYCAIEVGLGAWRPHRAQDVETVRYGDCKDKANLLRTLLSAVGVPSKLGAIWLHDGLPRPFGLPAVTGNFNHMIVLVEVGKETIFADPTARNVPFGALPWAAQGALVLPLTKEGAELATAPTDSYLSNSRSETYDVALEDQWLTGTLRLHTRGTEATSLSNRFDELGSTPEAMRPSMSPLGASVMDIDALHRRPGRPPDPDWPESRQMGPSSATSATVRRPTNTVGPPRLIRVSDLFEGGLPVLPATSDRKTPILLGAPRTVSLDLTLRGRCLATIPRWEISESKWISYKLSWSDPCTMSREWKVRNPVAPPGAFSELKKQLDEIRQAEARPLLLASPPP